MTPLEQLVLDLEEIVEREEIALSLHPVEKRDDGSYREGYLDCAVWVLDGIEEALDDAT